MKQRLLHTISMSPGFRIRLGILLLLAILASAALLATSGFLATKRGLIGHYYDNVSYSGTSLAIVRNRTIDLETLQHISPPMTVNFSIRWVGEIYIPQSGEYAFVTRSDDGSVLEIDGRKIVDNSGYHSLQARMSLVVLKRGFHAIEIRYVQEFGAVFLEVFWARTGQPREKLSAAWLYSEQPGVVRFFLERTLLPALVVFVWIFWGMLCILLLLALINVVLTGTRSGRRVLHTVVRRKSEIGLFVCSTMFCLVLAEVVVRYAFPRYMYPFHGVSSLSYHHLYPEEKEMFAGVYDDEPVVVRTNEDGLRSSYSRREFLRYTHRIAVLGDSFTFGFGVRQEKTFPQVLEQRLRKHAPQKDYAVLNAGVIGSSPFLEDVLFEGVVEKYQPTIVLLVLDATDIGNDLQFMREALYRADGTIYFHVKPSPTLKYYGAIHEILRPSHFQFHYDYYKFEVNIDGTIEENFYFIFRHPLEKTRQYFSQTFENINRIAKRVNASGAEFMLLVTPRFQHWNPEECPDNWEQYYYKREEPFQEEYFRFFDEQKDRVAYPLINLLADFQATEETPLVFSNDPHWNQRGHAFVAEAIMKYLRENDLIAEK